MIYRYIIVLYQRIRTPSHEVLLLHYEHEKTEYGKRGELEKYPTCKLNYQHGADCLQVLGIKKNIISDMF